MTILAIVEIQKDVFGELKERTGKYVLAQLLKSKDGLKIAQLVSERPCDYSQAKMDLYEYFMCLAPWESSVTFINDHLGCGESHFSYEKCMVGDMHFCCSDHCICENII